jgi:hypothetical protein
VLFGANTVTGAWNLWEGRHDSNGRVRRFVHAGLFMVASGVIVNTGSMGSHAMIVARELGIPCVGGIPGATQILKTGDTVRVNGATGVVEVLAV